MIKKIRKFFALRKNLLKRKGEIQDLLSEEVLRKLDKAKDVAQKLLNDNWQWNNLKEKFPKTNFDYSEPLVTPALLKVFHSETEYAISIHARKTFWSSKSTIQNANIPFASSSIFSIPYCW